MDTSLDAIQRHWEEAGKKFPQGRKVSPTTRDPFLGQLEEAHILRFLAGRKRILEIGCGDGQHTALYAQHVGQVKALDISDSLIGLARKRMIENSISNVELKVGSVLSLVNLYERDSFDCVISQRCLINLPSWKYQQNALEQVCKVLNPGGVLLMSEGFQEELDELNVARKKFNLDEITVVSYNRNLRHKEFDDYVKTMFEVVEIGDYGAYLFLSRVFHPLSIFPDDPKHDSPLNEAAMRISSILPMADLKRYSYNLCYVLRKK
jgi:ubiquinone/menaquinone biosynthesis C-methylase UbiE